MARLIDRSVLSTSLNISDLDEVISVFKKYGFNVTLYANLGLRLGLSYSTLKDIEANNPNDIDSFLRECLSAWLQRKYDVYIHGGPSWLILIDALKKLDENAVADGIENDILMIHQDYLESAMSEGYVELEVTTAVVQGEARVGKTSVKCMLVCEEYKGSSTSCIETPSVAVRCYEKREGTPYWGRVGEEEMEIKAMTTLRSDAEEKKSTANITLASSEGSEPPRKKMHHEPSRRRHHDPSRDISIVSSFFNTQENDDTSIRAVKEFYDNCQSNIRLEGSNVLRGQRWLYFIDTGGQIQFQKLLPAFMPCASVFFLVISLAKNLSSPSCQELVCHDGRRIEYTGHSMKVEEIIKQLLSSVASNAQRYKSVIENDLSTATECTITPVSSDPRLKIVTIATRRDEYDETQVESPETKAKKLEEFFSLLEDTCNPYNGPSTELVIHEVDGRKARNIKPLHNTRSADYIDPTVQEIAKALDDNAYKIKVPLRWYCFDVLLRRIISKEGHCGILTVSECQSLGDQLGMSPQEVISALKFLHYLNKLLFYPNSGEGSDIVFVRVNSLIDIIKDLVEMVCDYLKTERSPPAIKRLAIEGKLSLQVLIKSSQFCKACGQINEFDRKLIAILHHLLITVELLPGEPGHYLMPALLPIRNVSIDIPFKGTVPLLFYFKKNVPMGLFCALLVHLLSFHDDNSHWRTIKELGSNYSNYFTLQNRHIEGTFVLVEQVNCIEVHCDTIESRLEAKNNIEKAITKVFETHKLNKEDRPELAFYCNCKGKDNKHVAVVRMSPRRKEWVCECTFNGKEKDINDEQYQSWLVESTEHCTDSQPSVKKDSTNRELDIKNLREVKHFLKSKQFTFSKWDELGLELGLYQPTLAKIKDDERGDSNRCLIKCLTAWLKKEDGVKDEMRGPSWETLAEALEEIGEIAVASNIRRQYVL